MKYINKKKNICRWIFYILKKKWKWWIYRVNDNIEYFRPKKKKDNIEYWQYDEPNNEWILEISKIPI